MINRIMGKTGLKTSLLGFGCMRFPQLPDGSIDEEETFKMFDAAYNAGINYYDTAYMYHGGESERVVGKALSRYPRDTYFITTKLPVVMIDSLDDAKTIFENQRKKLNKEYFDFYLLHALNGKVFDKMVSLGVVDYVKELKKEGKIKNLGFSFHDSYEEFEKILNYWDWDLCQIQYNYKDQEEQAGNRGYELAAKKGIPMVIMEPVKGGSLAALPDEVTEPFRKANPKASNASFALRWVAGHDNVKVILSGMSSMEQLMDNIDTLGNFKPLNKDEMEAVNEVTKRINARTKIGCTGCKYCMPCPSGVNIPGIFKVWNTMGMYGKDNPQLKFAWNKRLKESEKPSSCIKCGQCEEKCPQNLSIREELVKAERELNSIFAQK